MSTSHSPELLQRQLDELKNFMATAPMDWSDAAQKIKRFPLPSGESVSCILWNGLFYVTGTDVVRAMQFRFQSVGRVIASPKKFEEVCTECSLSTDCRRAFSLTCAT